MPSLGRISATAVLLASLLGAEPALPDASSALGEGLPPFQALPAILGPFEAALWSSNGLMRRGGHHPLTPEGRMNELKARRGMLTAHLAGGLTTVGLLVSAVAVGQTMLDNPASTPTLLPVHRGLVISGVSTYSLSALLAALAPPPMLRRREFSTITLHRSLAFLHLAGMLLTPILGLTLARSADFNATLRFHQIMGITTAAALTLSMLVLAF